MSTKLNSTNDGDIRKMTARDIADMDAAARECVRECGGKIVRSYKKLNATPARVFHVKFSEPDVDDEYHVYVTGHLLCRAVDWTTAIMCGLALASSLAECFDIDC